MRVCDIFTVPDTCKKIFENEIKNLTQVALTFVIFLVQAGNMSNVAPQQTPDQDPIPDFLQADNPRSLYNMVAPAMQRAMERIPVSYFAKDESELITLVNPNTTLNCLRFRIWNQFQIAIENGINKIQLKEVCAGICSYQYLTGAVLRNPLMTMWLCTPPKSYETAAEEALQFGITQLRKVLAFPLFDENGKADMKVAKLQLDVVKTLHAQVRGAPVQRIEQRSVNLHASSRDVKDLTAGMSMEDIEKRLASLRGEEEKHELLESARPKFEEFQTGGIAIENENKPYGHGKKKEF